MIDIALHINFAAIPRLTVTIFITALTTGAGIGAAPRSAVGIVDTSIVAGPAVVIVVANFLLATIAKITGYCIGGGLATALCCDLRFATHDSKFGIPAAKLGLGYGYSGLKPLVQLVGPTHAKEIMFTARQFSAAEAYEMGLINQALTRRELNRFVYEYTETIANNAPLTIRACKRIINEIGKETGNRDLSLCERLVSDCFASQDYKEGRRAFMQKRAPRFLGK